MPVEGQYVMQSPPITIGPGAIERPIKRAALASVLRGAFGKIKLRGVPRFFWYTARPLLGESPALYELGDGTLAWLDPRDYFQVMMFYGRYSESILEIMGRYVNEGDAVIDVGAQIGFMSVQLAKLVGKGGRVYSFEPDPKARESLLSTLEANRMQQVTVFACCASSSNGEMPFFVSPQVGWSTGVAGTHLTNLSEISVESVTIDSLIEQGLISRDVRLIKIDVEGFECDVVRGAQKFLDAGRPVLIVEAWDEILRARGESVDSLRKLIRSSRYTIRSITKMDWLCLPE
jgi:FkbM family methyltransferase